MPRYHRLCLRRTSYGHPPTEVIYDRRRSAHDALAVRRAYPPPDWPAASSAVKALIISGASNARLRRPRVVC
jgi:hypothetical protein